MSSKTKYLKSLVRRFNYRKVLSSSMFRLEAYFQIFKTFMKGKFDVYVL